MTMARETSLKVIIAILALSVALVLLSTQPAQAAATASVPQSHYYGTSGYSTTNYCSYSYWWNYWGYPYYCNYYYYYGYGGYGYPYYYYGYPYYYYSPASYTLTVATDPSSLGTVTGSGTFTQGSSASFSVTQNTIQVSPDTRYVFSHWSGDYSGVGSSGTVTVNGAMKITAEYQLQYYLSVTAQPQSAPTPQGQGWYNANQTVTLQNAGQTIDQTSGSRLQFQGWSVDGQAPQSASSLNVAMNSPHTVAAVYAQQYYLNVQTDQGVPYGSGWYNAGSTTPINVSTPVSSTYGVSIVFNGWQGDIQSSSQSTTVLMDGPKNVIATWRTDPTVLYLTIAAIVIAAVLILAGAFIFASRGRGNTQAPPTQTQAVQTPPAQPPATASTPQPNEPTSAHRTEHHRRKPSTDKTTTETTPEQKPSTEETTPTDSTT